MINFIKSYDPEPSGSVQDILCNGTIYQVPCKSEIKAVYNIYEAIIYESNIQNSAVEDEKKINE